MARRKKKSQKYFGDFDKSYFLEGLNHASRVPIEPPSYILVTSKIVPNTLFPGVLGPCGRVELEKIDFFQNFSGLSSISIWDARDPKHLISWKRADYYIEQAAT